MIVRVHRRLGARLGAEFVPQLDEGDLLIREGRPGRELFLVVEGEAVVSLRDRPLATVGPGELVGEMALFGRAPTSASVYAFAPGWRRSCSTGTASG